MLELASLLDARDALLQRLRTEQETQAEALKTKCVRGDECSCAAICYLHIHQLNCRCPTPEIV
jgi:hypothetical protein